MVKPLVIFDINGFLCRKIPKNESGHVDVELQHYNVQFRPGWKRFLSICYDRWTVGFYSSTSFKNASKILDRLLTAKQKKETLFKWYRDRTLLDPDWNREMTMDPSWSRYAFFDQQLDPHSTIKRIIWIIGSPDFNPKRTWSEANTLICDDSPTKLRFNRRENCLLVAPMESMVDEILESLPDEIAQRFMDL